MAGSIELCGFLPNVGSFITQFYEKTPYLVRVLPQPTEVLFDFARIPCLSERSGDLSASGGSRLRGDRVFWRGDHGEAPQSEAGLAAAQFRFDTPQHNFLRKPEIPFDVKR